MHYQPDVSTISKSAPPSYAEAMAQPVTKDNSYATTYGQPMSTTTRTIYDQGCSQMPSYPSSAPANNFYSNISSQPAYNPSYVPVEATQQCRTTTYDIVRIEPIEAQNKFCNERCTKCNKSVAILLFFVFIIYLIKMIAF